MTPDPFDKAKLIQTACDLRSNAQTTLAVLLDAERGWLDQEQQLLSVKEANITKLRYSEKQALKVVMTYAIKRNDGSDFVLHHSTVAETLGRIGRRGTNHVFLANMCAASLYTYWETQARAQLADAFFGKYDRVSSDLFGDLRLIRHCILHCRGIGDATMGKCKMIKWFEDGDRIEFNSRRLHAIVRCIQNVADAMEEVARDPSPGVKAGSVLYGELDAQGRFIDLPQEGVSFGNPLKDPEAS